MQKVDFPNKSLTCAQLLGIYNTSMFKQIITVFLLSFLANTTYAHRNSDIDNQEECRWNEIALTGTQIKTTCNDLYHLYESQAPVKHRSEESLNIASFNIFKLGSGDSRFKNLKLVAHLLERYDLVSVSELQPSSSEEYQSNYNLLHSPELSFKEFYHKPGYLKLLLELQKEDSSWSLILSPVGQSDTRELLGFYFRASRVQLENSEYCEGYNRKIRSKGTLTFAGGFQGPHFKRKAKTPNLYHSYACLMDIENDENDIFRLPFSARFKSGRGFDFQYLSYHARFQEPIAVGGSCGFECLEKITTFLNKFHKEGEFMGVLDYEALRLIKNHIGYLSLSKKEKYALIQDYGSVIQFKYSKPRVYEQLIKLKSALYTELPTVLKATWEESYKKEVSVTDRDFILEKLQSLFESTEDYISLDNFVEEKGRAYKNFVRDVFEQGLFKETLKRASIWTSPEKISRFFELSLILKEMEKISSSENDRDVLLSGDFNLENDDNEYYWEYFLENNIFSTVAIGSPTSISERSGLKNSYDHFMYAENNSLEECRPLEASVLDFVNDKDLWKGFEDYFVTSKKEIEILSEREYKRLSNIEFVSTRGEIESTKDIIDRRGYKSCWNNQYHKNVPLASVWQAYFECNTLYQYLNGPDHYRLYTDLISDHIPIEMKCSELKDND